MFKQLHSDFYRQNIAFASIFNFIRLFLCSRQSKDQEVESERQKLEGLQRELQQRMLELEGELRVQRDQMGAEFDEVMKKREREHSTRVNEFSTGE